MKKHYLIFYFLFALLSTSAFAQIALVEKANTKYNTYDFIDARKIYLKVVEKNYGSAEIYRKLGNTYYFNSNYSKAAKWYYNLIDRFPNEALTVDYFRAAQCLKSINQPEEAEKLMEIYRFKGGKITSLDSYKNVADTLFKKGVHDKLFEIEKIPVNTEYSDFGPAFYGDNIVFASSRKNPSLSKEQTDELAGWDEQPFLNLYQVSLDKDMNFGKVKAFNKNVNSPYHESTAVFTKDGNTMYFTRNNYLNGKKKRDRDHVVRLKIYKATRNGNSWENTQELPFNSDNYSVGHPTLSPDEDRLYFSSDMPGSLGMSDIWYVKILGEDIYTSPVNLGNKINTAERETFPFVSDENNLYFSSDGHSGMGGLDIFVTKLEENSHGEVSTFGEPINSPKDDFGFIIKEDRIGYFTSNRDGKEGSKSDDIYQIWERCEITIQGPVMDKNTGKLIPNAEVTLIDSNNKEVKTVTVGNDATFTFLLDCQEQYTLRAKKEKYHPKEKVIETPNNPKTIKMPIKLNMPLALELSDPCPPNDLGCRLTLQPIYFDYDKSNIRPDAEIELAKILAALKEYPTLKIHIESHTDSRGNDLYNSKLSENRAQATLDWFFKKGIDITRLTAKGYGESELINKCNNQTTCSEDEHQLNRRSMFIIKE
ncbi:flagellar motor protein MotB [Tenacibaculum discolor]|uniref:Flagellar motor protein MotB n=1 Tax=Tenacibaculum discolor TaxID=361581 RepID=A0A2G1BTJ8_9FLAO|nr:OmpA family protein [Tenacibaculum discolor]MDP2541620.1 OmpA family protein [Tenacibaculum discolor]PHN97372.1 flagellar motor protein MotB [Tenacibaculum discolor]